MNYTFSILALDDLTPTTGPGHHQQQHHQHHSDPVTLHGSTVATRGGVSWSGGRGGGGAGKADYRKIYICNKEDLLKRWTMRKCCTFFQFFFYPGFSPHHDARAEFIMNQNRFRISERESLVLNHKAAGTILYSCLGLTGKPITLHNKVGWFSNCDQITAVRLYSAKYK